MSDALWTIFAEPVAMGAFLAVFFAVVFPWLSRFQPSRRAANELRGMSTSMPLRIAMGVGVGSLASTAHVIDRLVSAAHLPVSVEIAAQGLFWLGVASFAMIAILAAKHAGLGVRQAS